MHKRNGCYGDQQVNQKGLHNTDDTFNYVTICLLYGYRLLFY